ncbi:MAG: hypothetical protein KAS69_01910 [Planctomycetes bacterium]|nr:hypothetical protein [Planctomycetota bacterium]
MAGLGTQYPFDYFDLAQYKYASRITPSTVLRAGQQLTTSNYFPPAKMVTNSQNGQ